MKQLLVFMIISLLHTVMSDDTAEADITYNTIPDSIAPYYPPAPQEQSPFLPALHVGYHQNPGYSIQGGYDGYLVPVIQEEESGWKLSDLLQFLPDSGVTMFRTVGYWFMRSFMMLLSGTAMTIGLCTFTPVCTLTLLGFPFGRETTRAHFTGDRLSTLVTFVRDAIEKYQRLQKEHDESAEETTENAEVEETRSSS